MPRRLPVICSNAATWRAQFTTELSASFERSMTSVNFIVVVLILSAAALAFVVLYNLTNINITGREELATIKGARLLQQRGLRLPLP